MHRERSSKEAPGRLRLGVDRQLLVLVRRIVFRSVEDLSSASWTRCIFAANLVDILRLALGAGCGVRHGWPVGLGFIRLLLQHTQLAVAEMVQFRYLPCPSNIADRI